MTRTGRAILAVPFAVVPVVWGGGLPAYAADIGDVGPVYGTSTTAPTGQKPLPIGTSASTSVRMGDDSTGRIHDYRVDNVQVTP